MSITRENLWQTIAECAIAGNLRCDQEEKSKEFYDIESAKACVIEYIARYGKFDDLRAQDIYHKIESQLTGQSNRLTDIILEILSGISAIGIFLFSMIVIFLGFNLVYFMMLAISIVLLLECIGRLRTNRLKKIAILMWVGAVHEGSIKYMVRVLKQMESVFFFTDESYILDDGENQENLEDFMSDED